MQLTEYGHADELRLAMEAGTADVALGPRPAEWKGAVRPVLTERFVVLARETDSLSDDAGPGRTISLEALAAHPWIQYSADNGLSEMLLRACHEAGFEPRVAIRTQQTASVVALASAGLGIALVPENIVPNTQADRVWHLHPPITIELALYARAEPDLLTQQLMTTGAAAWTDPTVPS